MPLPSSTTAWKNGSIWPAEIPARTSWAVGANTTSDDVGGGGRGRAEMAQHGIELRARGRLFDGADHADAVGLSHRRGGGEKDAVERAHEDHGHLKLALADAADELHAVHLGHLQIGDDDVDGLAGAIQDGERLVPGGRLEDAGRAHAGERPRQQIALVVVVVDDQEAQAPEIDGRRVGDELDHAVSPGRDFQPGQHGRPAQ